MGKKSFKDLSYVEQDKFRREQAEKFDVDMSGYSQFGDASGARGTPTKSYDDLDKQLVTMGGMSYANNRALEAAGLSGNKKAEKISEMDEGMDQLYFTQRFMEKTHRNRMDMGGAYTPGSDEMAAKNFWVNRERSKQDASYYRKLSALEKQLKKARGEAEEEAPIEFSMSDRMQQSQDLLDSYTAGLSGGGTGTDYTFGNDPFDTRDAEVGLESPTGPIPDMSTDGFNAEPGTENITDDSYIDNTNENAADVFRDKYKFNVKEGLNLAGIPTRGPGTSFGA